MESRSPLPAARCGNWKLQIPAGSSDKWLHLPGYPTSGIAEEFCGDTGFIGPPNQLRQQGERLHFPAGIRQEWVETMGERRGGRRRKREPAGERDGKTLITTKMMRRTEFLYERNVSSFHETEVLEAGPVLTKL